MRTPSVFSVFVLAGENTSWNSYFPTLSTYSLKTARFASILSYLHAAGNQPCGSRQVLSLLCETHFTAIYCTSHLLHIIYSHLLFITYYYCTYLFTFIAQGAAADASVNQSSTSFLVRKTGHASTPWGILNHKTGKSQRKRPEWSNSPRAAPRVHSCRSSLSRDTRKVGGSRDGATGRGASQEVIGDKNKHKADKGWVSPPTEEQEFENYRSKVQWGQTMGNQEHKRKTRARF